mmetsp:Transcript_4755/g.10801  ORF Transcript_4755/g.10801 Transcript_4755/m.10801 type:complete len:260 (+) Transcript_4755:133-912(+)
MASTLILLLVLLLLTQTLAHQPSGCQVCATTGQCNAAFHNGPGQYCGSYYDISISGNKPCCCPLQSTCKVSPTQCMCHVANRQPASAHSTHYNPSHSNSMNYTPHDGYHQTSPLAPLIFILLCICCCTLRWRRRDDDHTVHHHTSSGRIPIATAIPATCPPYENPEYHHAPNYGSTMDGKPSSGGTGTAIASGLGGLAVGTMLGNLIGRNNVQVNNTQRGFGGGGGYHIDGDDGGGYDIVGDSGDYGGGSVHDIEVILR